MHYLQNQEINLKCPRYFLGQETAVSTLHQYYTHIIMHDCYSLDQISEEIKSSYRQLSKYRRLDLQQYNELGKIHLQEKFLVNDQGIWQQNPKTNQYICICNRICMNKWKSENAFELVLIIYTRARVCVNYIILRVKTYRNDCNSDDMHCIASCLLYTSRCV